MLKKVLPVCSLLFAAFYCSAQSIEMPSMPDMPVITAPKMDGTFYKPALPNSKKKSKTAEEKKEDSDINTDTVLSDGTTTQDLLESLLSSSNILSASDISSLYDSGSFDSISALTGINSSTTSSTTTNIMLQQILTSLEELKKQQNNASAAEKEQLNQQQQDNRTFKTRDASILRFKINGYSVTDSLTDVFFSKTESDGSFLLTADRKYFVNQKARTETFYMLFKTIKNTGASTTYRIVSKIAQDKENTNSYVYKLCQLKDLTAEKTGNLVVLHYDDDLKADILLDIDETK